MLYRDVDQLFPAIDLSEPELFRKQEAKQQEHQRRFAGKAALGLHATLEFQVDALDRVGCLDALPLLLREAVER